MPPKSYGSTYVSEGHVYSATWSEFPASILAACWSLDELKHTLEVNRIWIVQGGHVLGDEVHLHIATCRRVFHR